VAKEGSVLQFLKAQQLLMYPVFRFFANVYMFYIQFMLESSTDYTLTRRDKEIMEDNVYIIHEVVYKIREFLFLKFIC
jgi:hypothetical protein